jgi:hypothetical protein
VARDIMHRAMLARELQRTTQRPVLPVVYDQHMRFVDFSHALYTPESRSLFGDIPPTPPGPSPVPPTTPLLAYINVVREPVDRTISSYYYALSDNRRKEKVCVCVGGGGGGGSGGGCMCTCMCVCIRVSSCAREDGCLTGLSLTASALSHRLTPGPDCRRAESARPAKQLHGGRMPA